MNSSDSSYCLECLIKLRYFKLVKVTKWKNEYKNKIFRKITYLGSSNSWISYQFGIYLITLMVSFLVNDISDLHYNTSTSKTNQKIVFLQLWIKKCPLTLDSLLAFGGDWFLTVCMNSTGVLLLDNFSPDLSILFWL